jgi:hypothetical protein
MGKKIKKIVKSVTKVASKLPGNPGGGGSNNDSKAPAVEAPPTQMLAQADVKQEDATDTTDKETEAARKAAKRGGKQGLSVSRSGGTGINL